LSDRSWSRSRPASGFTLIEVIGALVIFSVGVLMVIQVSGALGTQIRYAGARSELSAMAGERLDSLESLPIASLTPGTSVDTVTVTGMEYVCTVVVTSMTPVLSRIDVSLVSLDGLGPQHSATSYATEPWE